MFNIKSIRKKLIQIKNAIKYTFININFNQLLKCERLYRGGYISLPTYKRISIKWNNRENKREGK
jgi:hypothetical protein